MFKMIFRILLLVGALFAALVALQYFSEQQADYIEIYNDDDMDGGYY